MITCENILSTSNVLKNNLYWKQLGAHKIYLTKSNQIVGSYAALCQYRQNRYDLYGKKSNKYAWEAHHILETTQISTLGVARKFPDRRLCLCALIPKEAHIRINAIFAANTRGFIDVKGVLSAYDLAHSIIGNYNGTSEKTIQKELNAIVATSLKLAETK